MFLDSDHARFDTLGWDSVSRGYGVSSQARGPGAACVDFAQKGKQILFVRNLTALSAAILSDLGYRVWILTQWRAETQSDIKYSTPGADDNYAKRRYLSDLQWEKLDRCEVEKPTKIVPEYNVKLWFAGAGYGILEGRAEVANRSEPIQGTPDGLVLSIEGGEHHEDLVVRRCMWKAVIVIDSGTKGSAVVSAIEEVMDKLGLDLSYKPPEFVPVKCK
jgi:hypothetical protein